MPENQALRDEAAANARDSSWSSVRKSLDAAAARLALASEGDAGGLVHFDAPINPEMRIRSGNGGHDQG